jgi:hypothetical protein
MTSRLYTICVVAFWLVATGWLFTTKIWPALAQGTPPDYREEFAVKPAAPPPPVAWDLYWNEEQVGHTVSQAYASEGEPSEMRSVVEFKRLAVSEVARELLGGFSLLTQSLLGDSRVRIDVTIATRLRLDWEGELQTFETAIAAPGAIDLLLLRGARTEEDRLRLTVLTSGDEASAVAVPQELNLPSKARFAEAFSPRTRMTGLSVGQRWTTPVVSPLSTSGSVRLVESVVEKRETITWQEQPVEAFIVVYRYDAGSGAAAREPVGRAWVRDDGLIVRQELPIGKARVQLERTSDERAVELGEALRASRFDLHFKRSSGLATQ